MTTSEPSYKAVHEALLREGVLIETNIPYLGPERDETLDLYAPPPTARRPTPAVVIIHGGGWTGLDKQDDREINIAAFLVRSGYVCVSINYLLGTLERPAWPTNLADCKNAVRFLRVNASNYGIDPDHIGVIGGSAGGHLVAMLSLTGTDELSSSHRNPYPGIACNVQAAVPMYPPTDLLQIGWDIPAVFGCSRSAVADKYRDASPVNHAHVQAPPFLIFHGTHDEVVPVEQSEILYDALRKAGTTCSLRIIEGAGHSFDLEPEQADLRPAVLAFFREHLGAAV